MKKAPVPYPPALYSPASASTFPNGYNGCIHTDAYSRYNGIPGVKKCLCYAHLRQAFVDALPGEAHTPETSKPAEAVLRLNQLFDIEAVLEVLPKSKLSKAFGHA